MKRSLAAAGLCLVLAGTGPACGTVGSGGTDEALFSRPEAIVHDLSDAGQATFAIFDRGRGELLWFGTDGQLETTSSVVAPDPGWGPTPPRVWRDANDSIVFAAEVSTARTAFGVMDTGAVRWADFPASATVIALRGAVTVVTSLDAPVQGLTLPVDAQEWPETVSDAPFAYRSTDGAISLWDPLQGARSWRMPVKAAAFAAGTDAIAWVEGGWLRQAALTTDAAPGVTASVPLPAAAVRLRYDARGRLWFSAADGGLYRVSQLDDQTLCLVDNVEGGASTGTPLFVDHGALSSPSIRFVRLGREGCPGWVRDDVLNVTFEGVPDGWAGLAAAEVTRWNDLPHPLTGPVPKALRFEGADGTTAVAQVADELAWVPPVAAPVTGVIRPLGNWVWSSARSGLVALAPTGVTIDTVGWSAAIDAGADPADRNDRFTVSIEASVDTFAAATVFSDFDFLASDRIVALDRKDASVTLIDTASGAVYGGIR
ncbi:MAG: hypothetical protein D6761_01990 [Candidatus Dadabacteria bacterium]|nr:MAG: hypothetical protein D6761_01990 [Candidatus Dadabacteria bacterium]